VISPHDRLAFHLLDTLDAVRGLARCQRRSLPDHARQSRLHRRARRLAHALTDVLEGVESRSPAPAGVSAAPPDGADGPNMYRSG